MPKSIAETLGADINAGGRRVPGSVPIKEREYWYIEHDGIDSFERTFLQIVGAMDPPFYSCGGAVTGGCELTLPDGRKVHAMSYRGDLPGWRKQVEFGAKKLDRIAARVVEGALEFSATDVVPISSCQPLFY